MYFLQLDMEIENTNQSLACLVRIHYKNVIIMYFGTSVKGVLNLFQTEGQIHTRLTTRGPRLINQENLLEFHGHLLIMLLTYYYKEVHILLNFR
jgi:hypothetical protein